MNNKTVNSNIDKDMKYGLGVRFHIVFWCIMLVYYFYFMNFFGVPFEFALRSKMFYFPIQLLAAYFMLFVLLGKHLYKGKYLKAIFGFIIFIFFMSYGAGFLKVMVIDPIFDAEYIRPDVLSVFLDFEYLISQYMRVIFVTPLILICLEFGVSQYLKMKDVEDLITQKNKTELHMLKSQIHPNFLLSTLRNLEKLTAVNDDNGPFVIEKLSGVLDYILYKGNQEKVDLQMEIDTMFEYVELENIRFADISNIKINERIIDKSKSISPLILFSFLEFNFKGYSKENIPFSNCSIDLFEVGDFFHCEITNSDLRHVNSMSSFPFEIAKMERQLDISYPNKYKIETKHGQGFYKINLALEL